MTDLDRFSQLLIDANRAFQQGKWNAAIDPLIAALEQSPFARGAGDAIASMGIAHYHLQNAHYGEIASLIAYRLRATLIDRNLLFNSLVNLIVFNMVQKSFGEAYGYGAIAEQIRRDDSDLLANMVVACAMTGRKQEAMDRFEHLKQIAPIKAGTVSSYFLPDSPQLDRTQDDDCTAIYNQLHKLLESQIAAKAGRPTNLGSYNDQFKGAIRELESHPEGIRAYDCWCELCKIYAHRITGIRSEYLKLQTWAGLGAASGKAINTRPDQAAASIELWRWRGRALSQLCFYELALDPLQKAASAEGANHEDRDALESCQKRMKLDESDSERPDSPSAMGLTYPGSPRMADAHSAKTVQTSETFKGAGKAEALLDKAKHLARSPGEFWKAYDLFARAIAEMPSSGEERLEHNQDLNHKAFGLFHTDKDEAAAFLCEAVAYVPSDMHSWQELGTIRFSQERFAEAEELQERAIEVMKGLSPLPPGSGRFWMNMANCRLYRIRTDSNLSEQERQSKRLKGEEEARFAIGLGEKRGHLVLRELARVGSPRRATKPWWKFW